MLSWRMDKWSCWIYSRRTIDKRWTWQWVLYIETWRGVVGLSARPPLNHRTRGGRIVRYYTGRQLPWCLLRCSTLTLCLQSRSLRGIHWHNGRYIQLIRIVVQTFRRRYRRWRQLGLNKWKEERMQEEDNERGRIITYWRTDHWGWMVNDTLGTQRKDITLTVYMK